MGTVKSVGVEQVEEARDNLLNAGGNGSRSVYRFWSVADKVFVLFMEILVLGRYYLRKVDVATSGLRVQKIIDRHGCQPGPEVP